MDAVAPEGIDPVAAFSSALYLQYQGGHTIVVDQTTVAAYHQLFISIHQTHIEIDKWDIQMDRK
jgi:hypothetical protein